MTLRQFAFNNVLRNRRIYAAYFLSSAFSVMVFFVYSMFAFHPELKQEPIHAEVTKTMHFAESLIYVFSFFFVLYSMSSFLKTRKREFGVLIMHGMTNMQLRRMVFMENMLIGFGATVFGIGIGLVFSKLILLLAQNVLRLEQTLPFYMPYIPVALTFAAFMVLFLCISLFTVSVLRGHKLIELIKGTAKPKAEPKASAFLAWTAALLLASGYAVALVVKGTLVTAAMIPVTIIVTVGTYLLFTQLSVYLIRQARSNRHFFWRRTNLILLSDLSYRMKDNAWTFFMVAILSTVAFSAIGSLVGFKSMYTEVMKRENPFAMEYYSRAGNPEELAGKHVDAVKQALREAKLDYQVWEAGIGYAQLENGKSAAFVRASEFNRIAEAAGEPQAMATGYETAVVYYGGASAKNPSDRSSVRVAGSDLIMEPVQDIQSVTLPLYKDYYVVSDTLFEEMKGRFQAEKQEHFYAFDVRNAGNLKDLGKQLSLKLEQDKGSGKFRYQSTDYELYEADQSYGVVLFIGFFIGIVFFVGAGSFLYFRLYTDLEEEKRKFQAIRKVGLSDRELSGILTKQVMILFFVPILTAVIHGSVALTALQNMFDYSLLRESAAVIGSFVLIQTAYFFLIRSRYIANVTRS
ncbi:MULTISPECIES: ABC transporter permease [Paenibacillus]|uniref:ABC transporter permease n=1 Tax=Paenibacillus TaxID=44249 RepID=UPI0022B8FD40|nr:ABC transporter permease [Paenibacillus caseinilyticus]MCZ8519599.1 ABC transporter permease [Paenibacillus caseinilyticus]